MAHITTHFAYHRLTDRLNRFPQGAPPSPLLTKILMILFEEKEAERVSVLPIKPFTAKCAARLWRCHETKAKRVLNRLADKALLVDFEVAGETRYVLPPPMAGFFEFSLMRVREDIDQKVLGELFYEYLNVEEDFVRALFGPTARPNSAGLLSTNRCCRLKTHCMCSTTSGPVLSKRASARAVGTCYCRHKMTHLGRACNAPMDICMTFNTTADPASVTAMPGR